MPPQRMRLLPKEFTGNPASEPEKLNVLLTVFIVNVIAACASIVRQDKTSRVLTNLSPFRVFTYVRWVAFGYLQLNL